MKKAKWLTAVLAAAVMALSGCSGETQSQFEDEVVATIDGTDVMKSEFMVYLYSVTQSLEYAGGEEVWSMDIDGMSADEVAKEQALTTLQSVIATRNYAAENQLELTEEQKEQAELAGENIFDSLTEDEKAKLGTDAKGMGAVYEDSYLYALAFDHLASQFEPVEADAEAYYQENMETLREDYTEYTLASIMMPDEETANEAYERYQAGEDFDALFEEYEMDEAEKESEDKGRRVLTAASMEGYLDDVLSMQVGDVTEPMQSAEGYFIFRVEQIHVPDDGELKIAAAAEYMDEQKNIYAQQKIQEMIDAQEVEIVQEVWDNLEKLHD